MTVKPACVWNQGDRSKCDCDPRRVCGKDGAELEKRGPLLDSVSMASQCTPLSLG